MARGTPIPEKTSRRGNNQWSWRIGNIKETISRNLVNQIGAIAV
jgi:hypothetical protein